LPNASRRSGSKKTEETRGGAMKPMMGKKNQSSGRDLVAKKLGVANLSKTTMALFIVVFDKEGNWIDATLTRNFPASVEANPDAFFPDGYSPDGALVDYLNALPPEKKHFLLYGKATTECVGEKLADQTTHLHNGVLILRVVGKKPPGNDERLIKKVCTEATECVHKMLEASQDMSPEEKRRKAIGGKVCIVQPGKSA
jgi:hypothetical protein